MKYIIVILSLLLLLNGDEPKNWSSADQLTWEDFKGTAKENYGAVAVTASGITFAFNVKTTNGRITDFVTSVEAQFHPGNSWYIKEKASPYILAHEQLHFDITELYVRKLRKRISELRVNPHIKDQLKELHQAHTEALKAMQNQYDAESEHSINVNNQLKWEAYIEVELNKYEEFASE